MTCLSRCRSLFTTLKAAGTRLLILLNSNGLSVLLTLARSSGSSTSARVTESNAAKTTRPSSSSRCLSDLLVLNPYSRMRKPLTISFYSTDVASPVA